MDLCALIGPLIGLAANIQRAADCFDAFAHDAQAQVIAVDRSAEAVAVATANAASAGVDGRVRVLPSDWTAALDPGARFDLVVSNPPYIPSDDIAALAPEVRREPRLALDGGSDGLDAYRLIVPQAARVLAPGGALVLEVGAGQAERVAALLVDAGFDAVGRHADLAGIERVVDGLAVAGSARRAASS